MPPRFETDQLSPKEQKHDEEVSVEDNYLSQDKFDDLLKATELLQEFISRVEQEPRGPKRNVIYDYSGKYELMNTSSASITRLLDKRIERMFKNRKIKRNWSEQDLQILVWVVYHHAILNGISSIEQFASEDWNFIAQLIPGASGQSCMFRVLSLKKFKLAEQKWRENQSLLLAQIVGDAKKPDWKVVSHNLFKRNQDPQKIYRNPKQCKQHWTCYLNPALRKGPWDIQEDIKLFEYVFKNNGKRKWADMAKIFRGRTENALKNRYSLILQKDIIRNNYTTEFQKIEGALKLLYETKNRSTSQRIEPQNPSIPKEIQIYEDESREHKNPVQVKQESISPQKEKNNIQTDKSEQGTQKKQMHGHNSHYMNGQNMYPYIYTGNTPFFMVFGNGSNQYI